MYIHVYDVALCGYAVKNMALNLSLSGHPWNRGTGRGAAKKGKDMIKTFAVLSVIMSFTLLLQVPCQLALEIMRCYNSLSFTSFTMSIVFDCPSHRAMPFKIFSLCLPLALFLSIFAVVTRYFAFSLHAQ